MVRMTQCQEQRSEVCLADSCSGRRPSRLPSPAQRAGFRKGLECSRANGPAICPMTLRTHSSQKQSGNYRYRPAVVWQTAGPLALRVNSQPFNPARWACRTTQIKCWTEPFCLLSPAAQRINGGEDRGEGSRKQTKFLFPGRKR